MEEEDKLCELGKQQQRRRRKIIGVDVTFKHRRFSHPTEQNPSRSTKKWRASVWKFGSKVCVGATVG